MCVCLCVCVCVCVCVCTHILMQPHKLSDAGGMCLPGFKSGRPTHFPVAFFYLSQSLPIACVESTAQETALHEFQAKTGTKRRSQQHKRLLGLHGDQISQSKRKSVLNIHWRDWCWSWSSNTLATWCEELIHWKRPWCWERLKAGGEGDDRGWGGWVASPTWWTWVSASSRNWWWTGKPGVLQSQGVAKNQTRLSNWIELILLESGTKVGAFLSFLCN